MNPVFTIKGVLNESYAIIKPQFWNVVGKFLLIILLAIIFSATAGKVFLLSLLVSTCIGMTINISALIFASGRDFTFETFAEMLSWKKFFYYLITALLAGLIVCLGFILLIIPGILLALRFSLIKYIVVDQTPEPVEALKASARMTKGYRGKIFCFFLLALLINILGAMCLLVGVLFTFPLTTIAFALIYKKLANQTDAVEVVEEVVVAEVVTV
jgi:uncharacterized membrane protein